MNVTSDKLTPRNLFLSFSPSLFSQLTFSSKHSLTLVVTLCDGLVSSSPIFARAILDDSVNCISVSGEVRLSCVGGTCGATFLIPETFDTPVGIVDVLVTFNTSGTLDILWAFDTQGIVDTLGILGTVGTFDTIAALDTLDTLGTVDTPGALDILGALDALGRVDTLGALDTLGELDRIGTFDTIGALEILNEVNVESLTNSSIDGIGASLLWIWVSLLTFAFLSSSTEEELPWVLLFIESLIP